MFSTIHGICLPDDRMVTLLFSPKIQKKTITLNPVKNYSKNGVRVIFW